MRGAEIDMTNTTSEKPEPAARTVREEKLERVLRWFVIFHDFHENEHLSDKAALLLWQRLQEAKDLMPEDFPILAKSKPDRSKGGAPTHKKKPGRKPKGGNGAGHVLTHYIEPGEKTPDDDTFP